MGVGPNKSILQTGSGNWEVQVSSQSGVLSLSFALGYPSTSENFPCSYFVSESLTVEESSPSKLLMLWNYKYVSL